MTFDCFLWWRDQTLPFFVPTAAKQLPKCAEHKGAEGTKSDFWYLFETPNRLRVKIAKLEVDKQRLYWKEWPCAVEGEKKKKTWWRKRKKVLTSRGSYWKTTYQNIHIHIEQNLKALSHQVRPLVIASNRTCLVPPPAVSFHSSPHNRLYTWPASLTPALTVPSINTNCESAWVFVVCLVFWIAPFLLTSTADSVPQFTCGHVRILVP